MASSNTNLKRVTPVKDAETSASKLAKVGEKIISWEEEDDSNEEKKIFTIGEE